MNEGSIYLQCETTIQNAARQFCARFPHLDPEEVQGEASLHFIEAVRTYRPEMNTKIETWVYHVIQRRLMDKTKRGFHANLAKSAFPVCSGLGFSARTSFNLRLLLSEVSDDASKVITLAVQEQLRKGVLKQVLADLGWTKKRIEQTFQEIRESL